MLSPAPMSTQPELTLDAFLAMHPWPTEHASERRLEWFWTFDIPVAPAELWPVIADSSRMNRALGVSEMQFEERGGARWGSSTQGGFRHAWIEVPWSWVAGQWLTSVRLYERGFSKVVYGAFHLSPRDDGRATRLHVYFGAIPRSLFSGLVLRFGFSQLEKDFLKLWPRVAAEIEAGRAAVLALPSPGLDPEAEQRLASIQKELHAKDLDRSAVDELLAWIRTGDEQDLQRIQVRERARAFGVGEDDLLRVCLHATRGGLLDLSWDVVCPHCRSATFSTGVLGGVPEKGLCEACAIDFGTGAEEAVEITFHVHSSIRDIPKRMFCSAEPARKAHIRVQRAVGPGGEAVVAPKLAPGRYRLRLHGRKEYGYLDVGNAGGGEIVWRAGDAPSELPASASPVLRLVNDGAEPTIFVVEASQWGDVALRPGRLLRFQDFRDLFSEEYLGTDVQLGIGEQTILFTDMVGSTAMYAARGDPAAFVEVKRHFADVFAIIAKHRGAVVKTIGDAAMGAFNSPLDAVRASKAIHDRFHALRAERPIRLRISLNTGPCIAVKLNTNLDYFGHTVNVAAKLQALAESFQTAMSEAVYAAPGVAAWLAEQGATLDDLTYSSKAIPEPIPVKRWTVYG
jgi:class 3 adenylate cyclase